VAPATRSRIVKIGNSQGVRIPKPLLEQAGLHGEVELEVQEGKLVIRNVRHPRDGWAEQFKEMGLRGDERLPDWDSVGASHFDENEWEW
jgi:antitoxin MazE